MGRGKYGVCDSGSILILKPTVGHVTHVGCVLPRHYSHEILLPGSVRAKPCVGSVNRCSARDLSRAGNKVLPTSQSQHATVRIMAEVACMPTLLEIRIVVYDVLIITLG